MKRVVIFMMQALVGLWLSAGGPGRALWAHESTDTIMAEELIAIAAKAGATPGARLSGAAHALVGTDYVSGTLEGDAEMVTINLGELDCTTFVETAIAAAISAGERRMTWHDFENNIERVRYRGGHADGYASRLHYISDWAIDNGQRGVLEEISASLPGASYETKTLDFMGRHRNLYPAMRDDDVWRAIRSREAGFRGHRFAMVRTSRVSKATLEALREGDIVAFTTSKEGLDVSHIGIVTIVDGVARLLHASSKAGKVVVDKQSLSDYLRRAKGVTGIRVFRLRGTL